MANTTDGLSPLAAYEELMHFAKRRGESALRLAMHAAVPQGIQPELLHLLKRNFVPEAGDDPALEADVLFSALCEELGRGYFRFDPQVRALLLENLAANYSTEAESRIVKVADFLLAYVDHHDRSTSGNQDQLWRDYLEMQRWVGFAFGDASGAAQQLAAALENADSTGDFVARIQLGGLASALAAPLSSFPSLLNYAAGLQALELGDTHRANEFFASLQEDEIKIGNTTLRSASQILAEWQARHPDYVLEPEESEEQETLKGFDDPILGLKSANVHDRFHAAKVLGETHPASERALRALIDGLEDADAQVRQVCVLALAQIGTEASIIGLSKSIADPDSDVGRTASAVLKQIGRVAVLILGRFDGRENVASSLSEMLLRRNYLAVFHDRQPLPENRLSEIAKDVVFVVADVTGSTSVPIELQALLPLSIPVQPIAQGETRIATVLSDLRRYPSLLTLVRYGDVSDLEQLLEENIIPSLESWIKDRNQTASPSGVRERKLFEHDVFISFAHADNQSPDQRGRVDLLVEGLSTRLAQLMGERLRIFFDTQLASGSPLQERISDAINRSAVFIVVLSPFYINSDWCRRELEAIADAASRDNFGVAERSRIFKVSIIPVPIERQPAVLHGFLGYEFYEMDSLSGTTFRELLPDMGPENEGKYRQKLEDLAWNIKEMLEAIDKSALKASEDTPPSPAKVEKGGRRKSPTTPYKYDAFISYSSADRPWAKQLADDLATRSFKIFFDRTNLDIGNPWEEQLDDSLDVARHLIVLWSKNASASTYVEYERTYFHLKTRDSRTDPAALARKEILILLEDPPPTVRNTLQTIPELKETGSYAKGIDQRDVDAWSRVLVRVEHALRGQSKAVYLAETTSDLSNEREQLKQELRQRGYIVLPDSQLPRRVSTLNNVVRGFLRRSDHSIHLIGQTYGAIPEGTDRSVSELEYELAGERISDPSFSRTVWMPREPKNSRQQRFLKILVKDARNTTVLQNSFGNFTRMLLERLRSSAGSTKSEKTAVPSDQTSTPIHVLILYDRKDQRFRAQLSPHLRLLQRERLISSEHDLMIAPSLESYADIEERLNSSNVILLLLSPDFLASDFAERTDLQSVLQRHEAGEAVVIPVIVRPSAWQGSPYYKLQPLPRGGKPVTTWRNRDEAYVDIAQGIRKAVEGLQARRQESPRPESKEESSVEDEPRPERWPVRTGTDQDVLKVRPDIVHTTIEELTSLDRPKELLGGSAVSKYQSRRSNPLETTIWSLDCHISAFRLTQSGGYRLILESPNEVTINADVPDPKLVDQTSPWLESFVSVREKLQEKLDFRRTYSYLDPPPRVRVVGVGYFRRLHGQTGAAPNGVELHPMLDFEWLPESSQVSSKLKAEKGANKRAVSKKSKPVSSKKTNLSKRIFISYSHKDKRWMDRLVEQLDILEQQNRYEVWTDLEIGAGEEWYQKIQEALQDAIVAVILVSANSLNSRFILKEEVVRLLQRREQEGLRIIPIIVEDCAWQLVDWLARMQVHPRDGRSLGQMKPPRSPTFCQ